MADNQPKDHSADDIEVKGGWQRPEKTGGWRRVEPESQETGGWTVPAMPADLSETPSSEGIWHLPRPEDTRFGPQDEIEISPTTQALRPEDVIAQAVSSGEAPAAEAAPPEAATGDLASFTGLADLVVQLMDRVEDQPKPDIMLEEKAGETTAPASDFGDEALPERQVLSQAAQAEQTGDEATELHPADYARQQLDWLTSDQQDEQGTVASPEDYARQQLAALEAEQAGQPAQPEQADVVPSASDPAAIARQQVEKLSGSQPAPAAPQVELPEAILAAKFRDTEQKVRALRQQYQNGQMTREQLQARLRDYLILDNNDQWWMMGVDTNTWYRYDNTKNDWVIDTPPVPLAPGALRTATSRIYAGGGHPGQSALSTRRSGFGQRQYRRIHPGPH